MEDEETIIDTKTYEIKSSKKSYLLTIKLNSKDNINFQLRQTFNFPSIIYNKEFSYEELLKQLSLSKEDYNSASKVFKYYESVLSKNNISLVEERKLMKVILKRKVDSKEVEDCLSLEEEKVSNEDKINMLFNDISELRLKNINEEKKNEELEKHMNKLIEENKNIKKEKEEMKREINSLNEENRKLKLTLDNLHDRFKDFKYNRKKPPKPENLRFIDYLTNNNLKSGFFAVFTGLTDNLEYLVFNNKNNYNLDVMTLKDKAIVRSLKGHESKVHVIRYFNKDDKNEYLLSCDEDKVCIVWDIQNDYKQKVVIKEKYCGNIFDALLLFNINGSDYIALSSGNANEYTKLFAFRENSAFIKNIYGTNKNNTNYLIYWKYNNKNYIIELCDKKITVNSLFDDAVYANLSMDPEGFHFSGFLYKDNYLCVSDGRNNFVRVWDLVHKSVYKQIRFDASNANEITFWDKKYAIVGCKSCFVLVDLEEEVMVKKVVLDNTKHYLCGVKKIKLVQLGECLIASDDSNNIRLFSV